MSDLKRQGDASQIAAAAPATQRQRRDSVDLQGRRCDEIGFALGLDVSYFLLSSSMYLNEKTSTHETALLHIEKITSMPKATSIYITIVIHINKTSQKRLVPYQRNHLKTLQADSKHIKDMVARDPKASTKTHLNSVKNEANTPAKKCNRTKNMSKATGDAICARSAAPWFVVFVVDNARDWKDINFHGYDLDRIKVLIHFWLEFLFCLAFLHIVCCFLIVFSCCERSLHCDDTTLKTETALSVNV